MSRIFSSLLIRTTVLFALALALSQMIWMFLMVVWIRPLQTIYVAQLAAQANVIRAALVTMPEAAQSRFLQAVNQQPLIRVLSADTPYGASMAPAKSFSSHIAAQLGSLVGEPIEAHVGFEDQTAWLKLRAGPRSFWLISSAGASPVASPGWAILWLASTLGLSIAAAYALSARQIRFCAQIVSVARTVSHGARPDLMPVNGPNELRQVSRALNEMVGYLHRTQADLHSRLAGVAHDLRSYLVRLRLQIELSVESVDQRSAAAMTEQIAQIDKVLRRFVELAHDEEPFELGDPNGLIAHVCDQYRSMGYTIKNTPQLVGVIPVRPIALRRILINLIDNALRYGGRDVEVATIRSGADWILTVSDRGPGLAPNPSRALARQLAGGTAPHTAQGTGLGLSVVRRLVRAHDGSFELVSRGGDGVMAVVQLPVTDPYATRR